MARPLPVGTDTDEPTALLYLNPTEYRIVKRILNGYQRCAELTSHEYEALNRVIRTLDGEANHYGP